MIPIVLSAIALAGCAFGPARSGGGATVPTGPLEEGDFAAATATLRALAAECENGAEGRDAVLVRALLELDPRNADGSPDTAAHLAARYLQLPDADPAGVSSAEALYLMSLDRGAIPIVNPLAYEGMAHRFSDCDDRSSIGSIRLRELPPHPGTPAWRSLLISERALNSLQTHADSLRSELERIRRTLMKAAPRP